MCVGWGNGGMKANVDYNYSLRGSVEVVGTINLKFKI